MPSDLILKVRANAGALRTLARAGLLNPRHASAANAETKRWGTNAAGGYAACARLYPMETAIVDERGRVSFAELHAAGNAMARGLRAAGIGEGDTVAILCRNHRWFVYADIAALRLGATALYLNTGFAGPQAGEVLDREGAGAVIYDDEFADVVEPVAGDRPRFLAWHEEGAAGGTPTLDGLADAHDRTDLEAPTKPGRQVILTSGTTGTPKGAKRPNPPRDLVQVTAMMSVIPFHTRDVLVNPAPMFHAWGNGMYMLAASMANTLVLRRRFDPEVTLRDVADNRARVLTVVPVMLQRMLDLPDESTRAIDVSSLEVVASSGAALPGSLALRWMDTFGDNLYNSFASTEAGQGSIATPADLRAAPGTAGKPPPGTIVRIVDDAGIDVPQGETGRIFIGNGLQFEGYTGGAAGKEMLGGLMSIGDVGFLDEDGRLFVGGRDDDMIVSGGENVYPREVEDLLSDHEAVREAAVIGVPDDDYGQRLAAYLVLRDDADLDEASAKAYVKENLANYKVPREVQFLDALPRNASGKVLKRALPT